MLFILVTRWCCVISVCLIISHSVSLSALSAIPPSAGQAGDWRVKRVKTTPEWPGLGSQLARPGPWRHKLSSLAAQTCKERSQTKEILTN